MLKILHGMRALEGIVRKTNIILHVFLNIEKPKDNLSINHRLYSIGTTLHKDLINKTKIYTMKVKLL